MTHSHRLKSEDIKAILFEEMQNKKIFNAAWNTACDICGNEINNNDGDSFIFMGNKKKICVECEEAINLYLQSERNE